MGDYLIYKRHPKWLIYKNNFWSKESCKMKVVNPNPINSRNVMHNAKSLSFSRTALSALSGISAGILGLTSLKGFFFYFIMSGILGIYYLILELQSEAVHFLSKQQLLTSALSFENLFTYVLMWTLCYGCVHVYWRSNINGIGIKFFSKNFPIQI